MCNTLEFQFDEGDCCLTSTANDQWDTNCDECQCFCPVTNLDNQLEPAEPMCAEYNPATWNADLVCPQAWLGDGFCDDDCNHPQFGHDVTDCCSSSNLFWNNSCADCKCYQCIPDSECYVQPELHLDLEDLNSICTNMIGDGFCEDICNHPEQVAQFPHLKTCKKILYTFLGI